MACHAAPAQLPYVSAPVPCRLTRRSSMRLFRARWLLVVVLAAAGCLWPTEQDIEDAAERQLRSVSGPWTGISPTLTLDFQLTEGSGSAVSGSGTMKETAAASPVPITVTGTFQRPTLSLTDRK